MTLFPVPVNKSKAIGRKIWVNNLVPWNSLSIVFSELQSKYDRIFRNSIIFWLVFQTNTNNKTTQNPGFHFFAREWHPASVGSSVVHQLQTER